LPLLLDFFWMFPASFTRSVKIGLWRFAFPGAFKKAKTKAVGLAFEVEESGWPKTVTEI
jgi:hypothetical protein